MTLFGKYFDLRIGQPGQEGKRWSSNEFNDIRITFNVERKGARSNAKLKLSIYNLGRSEARFIEQEGNVVQLIAGYRTSNGLLFSGAISKNGVTSSKEGNLRVTNIEAGEKESDLQSARISKTFEAGQKISEVLSDIASSIGVSIANIADVERVDDEYLTGWSYFGRSRNALDEVVNQLGPDYSWILQDGQIWILDEGETINQEAVVLRATQTDNTGVIGEPQEKKRGLDIKCLLRPQLRPGRLVKVETDTFNAFYKVTQATHSGDTWGNDWTSALSCREVKT